MAKKGYVPTRLRTQEKKAAGAVPEFVPGLVLSLLLLGLSGFFVLGAARSGMVPTLYIAAIGAVLLVLCALIFLLTRRPANRLPLVLGIVFELLVAIILIYGIIALQKVSGTLSTITTTRIETSQVAIYVLTEDPAESLSELEGEYFGILAELDRDNTDAALSQLEEELSCTLSVTEYAGITELVDALLSRECRVIVLNRAYVDVLADLGEYADIEELIREFTLLTVELVKEVEVVVDEDGNEVVVEESGSLEELGSAFVIYISGSDSRTGLSTKARSDVNIIAVANLDTHQLLLVSTPRDYYVPLSISNGVRDKLTHAGIYGVQVSMDTLAMLYDIDINYYFKISFEGLSGLVDALGGVSVYSAYAFTSTHGGYSFSVGYNTVNGAQALGFVRERYAFSDGDIQRGKNQMAMIKAIANKALSPSILVNYASVLSAIEDCFDTNIPSELITALVSRQLSSGASWEIITYNVSGTDSSATTYSIPSAYAYVMVPDESTIATAQTLIAAVLAGETITQP